MLTTKQVCARHRNWRAEPRVRVNRTWTGTPAHPLLGIPHRERGWTKQRYTRLLQRVARRALTAGAPR
jgi:hypothetical protein